MASDELAVVNQMLDAVDLGAGTLEERRATMDSFGNAVGDRAAVTAVDAGGVPGEWVVAPEADSDRVVLYLHGGGYCMGSPSSHRRLVAALSAQAKAQVLSLD